MYDLEMQFSYAKNSKNEDHIIAIFLKLEQFVTNVSLIT